ncbi:MAG: hypothetical protein ACYC4U_11400 [Pirellulaceae bacterium]
MADSRFNASANRFVDSSTGRFIAFKTEAKIQLRLKRIVDAAERSRAGNLRAVGYLISTIAKGLIKRSKTQSPAGQPVTTRKGLMRKAIRYEVAADKKSVVVGPSFSIVGTAGEPHEHGGRYKGETFPQRATMGPALEQALPMIGPRYKVS